MDRRNLFTVGARPDVLTGTLANRPAAGFRGRTFIADPVLTATAASGSALRLPFIDTGSAWIAGQTPIFRNTKGVVIQGTQTSLIALVAATGTRSRPVLMGGVIPAGGPSVLVQARCQYLATNASNTFTCRGRYGSADVITQTFTAGSTGSNLMELQFAVWSGTTATRGRVSLVNLREASNVRTAQATFTTVNSLVSQTLDLTLQTGGGVTTQISPLYVNVSYLD